MSIKDQNQAKELLQKATASIRNKNFQQAVQLCQTLTNKYPDMAEGWHLRSLLAAQMNNLQLSLETISKAINLSPDNYPWILHKIHALLHSGAQNSALELALHTAKQDIDDSSILEELALFLSKYQYIKEAKLLYQQALLITPQVGRLYYNLAVMHNYLGEIKAAEVSCNKAIAINKFDSNAHFMRSSLAKQTVSKNHIAELAILLKEVINNPTDRAQIYFALAKEYEDCKDYTASFNVRSEGAKLYRKSMDYDFRSDLLFINNIIETYNQEIHNKLIPGFESKEPIFILGLPRSGSTLVERILSNHSDVYSAGELTNFTQQMISQMQAISTNPNPSRTEMVILSGQLNFKKLGQSYLESTRPLTAHKQHFIDKFPQNSLYVGPIHLALPNASIIFVERHPLDVCYAMYKQLFTEIYQFSYDLEELADYFIAHQKLMEHWQKTLPGIIHVVRYEDLLADAETSARKMLSHCNLDWQPRCLDFQNNKQVTMTASAAQVRQKMYTTSVGMWRNYETQLEPLINKLDAAGILKNWPM